MTRRLWAIIGLALVGFSVAGIAAKQSIYRRLPVKANFIEAVRHDLAMRSPEQNDAYCLRVPVDYPPPDARTKIRRFGWHADFIKDVARRPDGVKQLEQLDALAAVGLLQKDEVAVAVQGSASQSAWRYRLTAKGWAQQAERRECFVFGSPSYMGFVGSEEATYKGATIHMVKVRVGLPGPDALPTWAKDARVQKAFPQIENHLKGQVEAIPLQWRDGRWQRYSEAEQFVMTMDALSPEGRRRLQALADMPDPTRADIESLMSRFPHQSCLILPGSEKLPADKVFYGGGRYRFGIYLDKERTSFDRATNKTVPVVERLVATGGLVRLPNEQVPGDGIDKGKVFDTAVYALAPQLQALMVNNCISLGSLTHEFLDVQYKKIDQHGLPTSSFTFKKVVRLKNPPAALTDAVLLSTWPDLRGILENGHACSGEFHFNKETRESEGGAATCWYAFDSYYENY